MQQSHSPTRFCSLEASKPIFRPRQHKPGTLQQASSAIHGPYSRQVVASRSAMVRLLVEHHRLLISDYLWGTKHAFLAEVKIEKYGSHEVH